MKKSKYTGILRRRSQDEPDEAAIYESLFGFYKIVEPFTAAGWEKLAKALAADHVPALSQERPTKEPSGQVGNKPKQNMWSLLVASSLVKRAMNQYGMKITPACNFVWRRGKEGLWKCEFETFRQNVSAITKIPSDKLFSEEPNDKGVVKRYKRDLCQTRYRFSLVERYAMSFGPDSAERKQFGAVKALDVWMLENFNVRFLGGD